MPPLAILDRPEAAVLPPVRLAGEPREGIRPPKFADKFAVLDFDAHPMPAIAMFPPPPAVPLGRATIEVRGDDLRRRTLAWSELSRLPVRVERSQLVCQIFNWHQEVEWRGIPLAAFLDYANIETHAEGYYAFRSGDGEFFETLSRDEARDPRTMLAFGMDGHGLPHEFGGPIRLVVPFLQGYKSVKWLSRVDAFRHDPVGVKRLLAQSKTGRLGQAWLDRLGIEPCAGRAGDP